jgi:hypothetical protein
MNFPFLPRDPAKDTLYDIEELGVVIDEQKAFYLIAHCKLCRFGH